MVRCVVPPSMARANVDEEGGGGECIGPKRGWDIGMEQEGADTVVEGAKNTFGAAVLLGGVGTG